MNGNEANKRMTDGKPVVPVPITEIKVVIFDNNTCQVTGFPSNNWRMALEILYRGINAIVNHFITKNGNLENKIEVAKPNIIIPH